MSDTDLVLAASAAAFAAWAYAGHRYRARRARWAAEKDAA